MTFTGTLGSDGEIEAIDKLSIATIGTLTLDAGSDADSRHPDTPLGSAPPVHTLWRNFLRYDPFVPNWLKIDRLMHAVGQDHGDTAVLGSRERRVLRVHLKHGGYGISALQAVVNAALVTQRRFT